MLNKLNKKTVKIDDNRQVDVVEIDGKENLEAFLKELQAQHDKGRTHVGRLFHQGSHKDYIMFTNVSQCSIFVVSYPEKRVGHYDVVCGRGMTPDMLGAVENAGFTVKDVSGLERKANLHPTLGGFGQDQQLPPKDFDGKVRFGISRIEHSEQPAVAQRNQVEP